MTVPGAAANNAATDRKRCGQVTGSDAGSQRKTMRGRSADDHLGRPVAVDALRSEAIDGRKERIVARVGLQLPRAGGRSSVTSRLPRQSSERREELDFRSRRASRFSAQSNCVSPRRPSMSSDVISLSPQSSFCRSGHLRRSSRVRLLPLQSSSRRRKTRRSPTSRRCCGRSNPSPGRAAPRSAKCVRRDPNRTFRDRIVRRRDLRR